MTSCTFFGHGDAPEQIFPFLKASIEHLITQKNVDKFYVGNHGRFDFMVRRALIELKPLYPHINYAVVLAYMPKSKKGCEFYDYSDTIYPDGLENVPQKYAIDKRNRWMISQCDYVVTYVTTVVGGAFKYKSISKSKGKTVLELYETI